MTKDNPKDDPQDDLQDDPQDIANDDIKGDPLEEIIAARPSDVLTVSEFNQLSDADKQAFRKANGTVTNDPISTN